MIPEVTKPVWSNVRPTFEEVAGMYLYVEPITGKAARGYIMTEAEFLVAFTNFVRYCILDLSTPEEPMELDGLNPQIINISDNQWGISYSGGARNFYFYGSTRSEAIHNANEFIRRVK